MSKNMIKSEQPISRTTYAYLRNGRKVRVLGKVRDGIVVAPLQSIYDGMDDVEVEAQPEIVQQVYPSAPVAKYSDEIDAARRELDQLRAEIEQAVETRNEVSAETTRLLKAAEKYEPLKRIDAIMEGEVTHLISICRYGGPWKIIDPTEHLRGDHRPAMLQLFGDPEHRTVKWDRCQYYDGSGDRTEVILCFSYEEAKERLAEWANSLGLKDDIRSATQTVLELNRHGIPIPPRVQAAYDAATKQAKEKKRQYIWDEAKRNGLVIKIVGEA